MFAKLNKSNYNTDKIYEKDNIRLMNLRFCFIGMTAITLFFYSFAFASEDSPSPFPDDMYISDLPELPETSGLSQPDLANNLSGIAENNNEMAQSITLSTPIDIPQENIEAEKQPEEIETDTSTTNINENIDVPKVNIPIQNNNESNEPKPIFVSNNENDTNNDLPKTININKSLTDTLKDDKKQNVNDEEKDLNEDNE